MSTLKEKSLGQSPLKAADQPEKTDEVKRAESLARLKGKMRPEIFEAYQSGLKRFDKLYRLLAK